MVNECESGFVRRYSQVLEHRRKQAVMEDRKRPLIDTTTDDNPPSKRQATMAAAAAPEPQTQEDVVVSLTSEFRDVHGGSLSSISLPIWNLVRVDGMTLDGKLTFNILLGDRTSKRRPFTGR